MQKTWRFALAICLVVFSQSFAQKDNTLAQELAQAYPAACQKLYAFVKEQKTKDSRVRIDGKSKQKTQPSPILRRSSSYSGQGATAGRAIDNIEELRESLDDENADGHVYPGTQTQGFVDAGYLDNTKTMDPAIAPYFYDWLDEYEPIIHKALTRESRFAKTHCVFYHAQPSQLRIVQDFLAEFYRQLDMQKKGMVQVRPRYEQVATDTSIEQFLASMYAHGTTVVYDLDPVMSAKVISTNFSLFGNIHSAGECTFYYFMQGSCQNEPNIQGMLQTIFQKYSLPNKHIRSLLSINELVTTEEGNLLQILIPNELVDSYVYPSIPLGTPLLRQDGTVLSAHAIARAYKDDVTQLAGLADTVQARMIISHHLFNDEFCREHNIKCFRYATTSVARERKYRKQLQACVAEIVRELITQWLSQSGPSRLYQDTLLAQRLQNVAALTPRIWKNQLFVEPVS